MVRLILIGSNGGKYGLPVPCDPLVRGFSDHRYRGFGARAQSTDLVSAAPDHHPLVGRFAAAGRRWREQQHPALPSLPRDHQDRGEGLPFLWS